jgi:hypothetical protein
MTKEEFFALGGTQENLSDLNFSVEEFMTNLFDHQELSTLYLDSQSLLNLECRIQKMYDSCPYDEYDDYIYPLWREHSELSEKVDSYLFHIVDCYLFH